MFNIYYRFDRKLVLSEMYFLVVRVDFFYILALGNYFVRLVLLIFFSKYLKSAFYSPIINLR